MAAVRRLLLLPLLIFSVLYLSRLAFSIPESEALIKFKDSLVHNGALDSWDLNSKSNPCDDNWKGVMCINEAVASLFLQNMSLSGTINTDALSEIPGLYSIALQNNYFTGSIPEFNKLSVLHTLFLSENNFSDEIPNDYFSKMTSLQKLWIDNNNFSGKIPESLMTLPNLRELHLEINKFSGLIPEPKEVTSLVSLDLSSNNLEGKIPKVLSKFSPASFGENEKLCGEPLRKVCENTPSDATSTSTETPDSLTGHSFSGNDGKDNKFVIAIVLICLLIFFLVIAAILAKRKERAYFSMLEKEQDHLDHSNRAVQVQVRESVSSGSSNSRKGGGGGGNLSRKSSKSARGGSSMGDLVMVNDEKVPFGLADLMKAAAEVLGNSGLGSSYKAAMANGLTVIVKRIREMNKMGRDTFDTELRTLAKIKHPNILPPLAYHFRREEKLIVSEYVPKGSLLYLLHGDRGTSHSELNWPIRLKIIKGIANGMGFLFSKFPSYELPHGNLKSSNVLLNENYVPLLSDYAFHPLTNPTHAAQTMFAFKSPEYIQLQNISPKSDVYCLGILILEIITGKFPSQYLNNDKGGIDVVQLVRSVIGDSEKETELIDPDILANAGNSVGMMIQLLKIGLHCTENEAEKRIDMAEAIKRIEEVHE